MHETLHDYLSGQRTVMVLLCPLASNATANSVLAKAVPSSGANVEYDDPNPVAGSAEVHHLSTEKPPARFTLPKNTIAASTRIAALTKESDTGSCFFFLRSAYCYATKAAARSQERRPVRPAATRTLQNTRRLHR